MAAWQFSERHAVYKIGRGLLPPLSLASSTAKPALLIPEGPAAIWRLKSEEHGFESHGVKVFDTVNIMYSEGE